MLEGTRIGLKVDVDTLRGTREGVPRLAALFKKYGVDATFYFSVGPDNTGRAMRRVFRKGFAQKVARTSVLKHYGLKTLLYGVLLPGPDIGRRGGDAMRGVRDAGFEVGLHTFDHVKWQDYVARATPEWTRREFERGLRAFEKVFGFLPASHAAAGWQINAHALELEREYGLQYASDTRGGPPFLPLVNGGASICPQLPTTLPTFDELLGRDGVDESTIADTLFEMSEEEARVANAAGGTYASGAGHSAAAGPGAGAGAAAGTGNGETNTVSVAGEGIAAGTGSGAATTLGAAARGVAAGAGIGVRGVGSPVGATDVPLQVFTLHAELEGMLLLDAFESLLLKWRNAGATVTRMATIHSLAVQRRLPIRAVIQGEIPGRSGLLAVQAAAAGA
jgi:undecaprenyl phosphate-alpha-L-ara4FN deformylase